MRCSLARWLDLNCFFSSLLFSLHFHFMYFFLFYFSFFFFCISFHSPFFGCSATCQIHHWFLSKDYAYRNTLTLIRFHWPLHLWCWFFGSFSFHFLISFHFIQSFLISYSIFRHFSIEHMSRSWVGRSVGRKQQFSTLVTYKHKERWVRPIQFKYISISKIEILVLILLNELLLQFKIDEYVLNLYVFCI